MTRHCISFIRHTIALWGIAIVCVVATSATAANPIARFDTVMGSFKVELFPGITPITVANFFNYVNDGDYDDTIIHRSVPNFVIQGGGYTTTFAPIPTDPPILDEVQLSNVRGTIATAKSPAPNSATSQWYFNLDDNVFLDASFTVFGQVLGDGMDVVDAIAALPVAHFAPPFEDLPVRNYNGPPVTPDELVVVNSITIVPEPTSLILASFAFAALMAARPRRCA